ncbi:unnamed protein product [Sphagnum jensenii]|uniref:Uncharacterized protein n=2 Tax=Sphagnum jensenii TaxID=128206 RepID=A0ABP0W8F7_9BRYO
MQQAVVKGSDGIASSEKTTVLWYYLTMVRVQFLGFGSEDYQWVSIKNAVWQRSFPCETIKACGCSSW